MDEGEAGSSGVGGSSQSILIPESPGSPDSLEISPAHSPQGLQVNNTVSETFTHREVINIYNEQSNLEHVQETNNAVLPLQNLVMPQGLEVPPQDIEMPLEDLPAVVNQPESTVNEYESRSTLNYDADHSTSSSTLSHFTRSSFSQAYNIPIPLDENTMSSLPETTHNDETEPESRIRKRGDCKEPPTKLRKLSSRSEELDGETCPICLDSWGNSGEHRLVALKCGHLFGLQCVERWLKAQPAKDRACPTCKTKSSLRDVRHIYARKLVTADTSQITSLQKQIEQLQIEKNRVELELQKSRIAHRACVMQLEVLRSTLMKAQVPKEQPPRRSWRFALEKNLEISKDGGCRVLTYNCRTYELYVSQKSTNNLFPGYGIRKVSCVDYKQGQFVHLHPKPIRDIKYSQPRDLLLSVGLDSSARIVERGILSVTVQAGMPLWSCSWDFLRGNEFYVGGVGGIIHQYDVRNHSTYLQRLEAPGDMSPVVSLCSTEFGLLSCQLNSCWLWAGTLRQWEPRALPVEGPFMSLCYDKETSRSLVSCRPGTERSRLSLCKFKVSTPSGEVLVDQDQTFMGSARSSLMSRAAWVKAPGASWVAAHSESDSALYLYGLDGARTMSLPSAEPALDVTSLQLNGDTLLAALSESRLRLYKAVST